MEYYAIRVQLKFEAWLQGSNGSLVAILEYDYPLFSDKASGYRDVWQGWICLANLQMKPHCLVR